MSTPAFGLYPTRDLVASQRLSAGAVLALQRPVQADGAKLFRSTCWLPVPASIAGAASLALAPAQFALRFMPARFDAALSDRGWFTRVDAIDASTLKIEFAWPASVAAVPRRSDRARHALALHRADGKAVAKEATQTGTTGVDLVPPWVGSPLVIEVGDAIQGLGDRMALAAAGAIGARVAIPRAIAAAAGSSPFDKAEASVLGSARSAVAALSLAGRPSSPRLSLLAERAGTSTLLWQALLPGEHELALLPEASIDVEWAGALEHLRAMGEGVEGLPERLRLEIESDAPCNVRFDALELGLHAIFELLAEPRRFGFDGDRVQSLPLELTLPASAAAQGLRITGRVVSEPQADAGTGTTAQNLGALLHADRAALQPVELAAPITLAGVAFDWLPLSSALQLRMRVLADDGSRPSGRVLAATTQTFETAQATHLVARWPALDLQAQTVWIEATPLEGAGLWQFADAAIDRPGWTETKGTEPQRDALPLGLRLQLLGEVAGDGAMRPVAVRLDGQVLAPTLPAGRFELDVPGLLLPLLATQPIVFEASVRAGVTVESARLGIAL
ncbi:MAG: hypothetical protein ABIO45_10575 [Burkholderiaceae bacterium]